MLETMSLSAGMMGLGAVEIVLCGIWGLFCFVGMFMLSFIVAEDAILRGSQHPVRWGFFTLCCPAITAIFYYFGRHAAPVQAGVDAKQVMIARKIRLKICLWTLGLGLGLVVATIVIVLFAALIFSSAAIS